MYDIAYELERINRDTIRLNSSIESLSLVLKERDIKLQLKDNVSVEAIRNVVVNSTTGTTEVSLEDITEHPYLALIVSIESDDNFIVKILKAIKEFILGIYRRILKVFKWIGVKIGLIKKDFEKIRKEVEAKKGVLKIPTKKMLDNAEATVLYEQMKTVYIATASLSPIGITTYISDLNKLGKFIDAIRTGILEANKKNREEMFSLDFLKKVKSYNCIKEPLLLTMLAISEDNGSIVPNKPNQTGEKYEHLIPVRIDKDNLFTMYLTPKSRDTNLRQLKYYKGKITDKKEKSGLPAIYAWNVIEQLIKDRNTLELSEVPDKGEKLLKATVDTINNVIKEIEKEAQGKDNQKEINNKLTSLREASNVLTTISKDIVLGYRSGLEDINKLLQIMIAEYE